MLNILQSILIAVLTPIAKVSSKINDRTRSICIQILCFILPLNMVYYYIALKHTELFFDHLTSHNARHLVGCFCLLLLIFFSLDRIPSKVKWSAWIMYPMIICGIWMMVISFMHPVGDGYRAFAMMLIVAYPCLYLVWNNRGDYENLFDPLARAVVLIGIIHFIVAFYLASNGYLAIEIGTGRITGLAQNANEFAMTGMVAACGALYLLVKDRVLGFRFLIYSMALGAGIAIVLMGQSRVSLMVCMLNIVVAFYFYLRYSEKSKLSVVFLKMVCIAGLVLTMILLSHLCILVQYSAQEQVNASAGIEQSETVESQSEKTSVIDRLDYDENTTLDSYTAGRYHIWKGYMQYMNLTGNDFSKANWDVLTQSPVRHAHNNFVEMAYRFGVPLGILFILLEVIVCLKALQYLFINRQKRIVLLWPIIYVVMFLLESMLDVATLPFERDAPFFFYLAIIPMVDMSYQFKRKQ